MKAGPGDLDPRRELRRALRQRRREASPAERMGAGEAIAAGLLSHPRFPPVGYVAGYWATHGEVPLHLLQMRLSDQHVWCLPCIQPDNSLKFAPWRPGDPLVSNRYGIPEPELASYSLLDAAEMALIVVPLVGFSRDCHRLGMGGGFYDRTLAFRRAAPAASPWVVGAGYAFQELDSLSAREWDVQLDAIATEKEIIDA